MLRKSVKTSDRQRQIFIAIFILLVKAIATPFTSPQVGGKRAARSPCLTSPLHCKHKRFLDDIDSVLLAIA